MTVAALPTDFHQKLSQKMESSKEMVVRGLSGLVTAISYTTGYDSLKLKKLSMEQTCPKFKPREVRETKI